MNPIVIFQKSWRIVWKTWRLWALTLLMYAVLFPALLLSGGIGALSAMVILPPDSPYPAAWTEPFRNISLGGWIVLAVGALVILVGTTFFSWAFQAAAIRTAAAAADGKTLSIREALTLGSQRWMSFLKLSLTAGVLIEAIALFPSFLVLALAQNTAWGIGLLQVSQTILSPISAVLGIVILLVMMSIALEDLRPRAAFGRALQVFRRGWWGFLLVLAANFLLSFIITLLVVPLIMILGGFLIFAALTGTNAAFIPFVAVCLIISPLILGMMTFAVSFSNVLYTLTYRAAATLTEKPTPATGGMVST
jgi:hypothetical protein